MHMIYPNDPEGLFSTINAFATTYAGYMFCLLMLQNKSKNEPISKTLKTWIVASLLCGLVVYPLINLMPLNKKIYSTSFTFIVIAISGLCLSSLVILIDILPASCPRYAKIVNFITGPFLWLGMNPLAVFVMMDLVAIFMIKYIEVEGKSLWSAFYKSCFTPWIDDPQLCSSIFAVFFLIVWTIFAGVLYRLKIFVKL
jgi:predicted acyltransferase